MVTYSRQFAGSLSVANSTARRPHPSSTISHDMTGARARLRVRVDGEHLRGCPTAVGRRLRPTFGRVLPLLLAPVGQQVEERERVTQLLGAATLRVVRAVRGVALTEEDVDLEATARRRTHVGAERAVGGRVPRHLVADPRLVRQRLVDRSLRDDHEPRVVGVEELEARELAREAGAAPALPLLT